MDKYNLAEMYDNLLDAGYDSSAALDAMDSTSGLFPTAGFICARAWYNATLYRPDEEKYSAEPEVPDIGSFVKQVVNFEPDNMESNMNGVSATQLVFEKIVGNLDAAMTTVETPDDAIKALAKEGLPMTIGSSPATTINKTVGDYSRPLDGGAVIRSTVQPGVIQYTVLKDALVGKDYWVRITQ